jgi:predicted nucleic acid-binding protein
VSVEGIILDASVAVKLVLDEEHREHAQALYEQAIRDGQPVLAPALLRAEVVNAIYRRRLRRTDDALTSDEAQAAVDSFLAIPITLSEPEGLFSAAYSLALTYELPTVYDAVYVSLAQMLDVELWTADRRLLNALAGRLPWVRWLGDYLLPPA